MSYELTERQVREIASLRRRHPGAELATHPRPWGVIVEARRGNRVLELESFDWTGEVRRETRIRFAAA